MESRIANFRSVVSDWLLRSLPDVKPRDISLPTDTKKIVAIMGPRRAGKTFLMYSTINKLRGEIPKSNILYINFEDDRLIRIATDDLRDILTVFYELSRPVENKPIYLFLDEIQLVRDWDKWVRRMQENGQFRIYISGSSSKLLSKELSTSLSGRSIDYLVLPFNFKEFLSIKGEPTANLLKIGYTEKRGLLLNKLMEYLTEGGYPEVIIERSEEMRLKILKAYYDTIFYKDLAEHFNVKDVSLLDTFLKYLISSYSKYTSVSKTYELLKGLGYKTSKKTLLNLLNFSSQVFFTFPIDIMSRSAKKRSINPKKIYIVDNGMIWASKQEKSVSRLMENLCFIELFRRKEQGNFNIAYWKEYGKSEGREVDFVLYDELNVKQLIQVSYIAKRDEVKQREKAALLMASKDLKCDHLLVITWDYEAEEKVKGKKIRFIPLWKWLLRL